MFEDEIIDQITGFNRKNCLKRCMCRTLLLLLSNICFAFFKFFLILRLFCEIRKPFRGKTVSVRSEKNISSLLY